MSSIQITRAVSKTEVLVKEIATDRLTIIKSVKSMAYMLQFFTSAPVDGGQVFVYDIINAPW